MKRYDVPDRHEMWARSRERLSLWFCQQFEDRMGFLFQHQNTRMSNQWYTYPRVNPIV